MWSPVPPQMSVVMVQAQHHLSDLQVLCHYPGRAASLLVLHPTNQHESE